MARTIPYRTFSALLTAVLLVPAFTALAQEDEQQKERNKFSVSAGFESNSLYYWSDKASNAIAPADRFGSNNYLKADISYGKFSAGVQAEAYLPALQGYPEQYRDFKLPYKYVSFSDDHFDITVGDFYTQFGNGLLLRAWEDRALGVNTAIEGVKAGFTYNNIVRITALYGRTRLYLDYTESWQRGMDASLSISSLAGWQKANLAIEGSYLNKYEKLMNPDEDRAAGMRSTINGYSGRVNFDIGGFLLKAEFVDRDPEAVLANSFTKTRSRAYLVEAGYYSKGLGMQLSLRKLQNMMMQSEREENSLFSQLNYLPALTQQYTYSLASLNPYLTQAYDEMGGQFDIFYNIARGTALGGKRGTKLHLNVSTYFGPEHPQAMNAEGQKVEGKNELYFFDVGFDIEKQWNSVWKTKLLYSMQKRNPILDGYQDEENWTSHIVVADVTYKFNKRHSLRAELQHLYMKEDDKSWAALMLEYSIAPKWSFFAADMWNYGSTKTHYYSGGVSYAHSKARVALNVGRFRQGYQCAGGVCRIIPAYTGANLTLTMSF